MKKLLLVLITLFISSAMINAQILKQLGEKAKNKAAQRANNKVDQAMDKGLDEVEGKNKKKDPSAPGADTTQVPQGGSQDQAAGNPKPSTGTTLSYNSKYDFVPGEKIIFFENFDNTSVGDFPENWNTNATAEIVTINTKPGKWMKIQKEAVFTPELIKDLPENFTLEFDLGVNNDWDSKEFTLNLANLAKPSDYTDFYHYVTWRHGYALHMQFRPANITKGWARVIAGTNGNHVINNTVEFNVWDNKQMNFAHISLWRQKQRLRIYLNGEKIFDMPKAFEANGKWNTITMAMQGSYKLEDYYLLGNIRLAVGAPDTRNKLITEGKFVTRGILFDVNSDRIKPESGGALKDIASILKENADVKVKIVGHTDADGDDKSNLELSKKRALAVKAYLVKEFGIPAANLETDGKGESEPADKNTTTEGKANNRRVEFIKL